MTWIYAYEAQMIERALERINDDDLLLRDVPAGGEIPESVIRELIHRRRHVLTRRSSMTDGEPVHSVVAWLEKRRPF